MAAMEAEILRETVLAAPRPVAKPLSEPEPATPIAERPPEPVFVPETTASEPEPDGDGFRLTGHKWFCSAPMSDGFLSLAQTREGLSCFLVPRVRPDGTRNAIRLQRLKDKLGNRSNASAEIEYEGAFAWPVGEPGRGVQSIIPMVHHTRLDTAMAPVLTTDHAPVSAAMRAEGEVRW